VGHGKIPPKEQDVVSIFPGDHNPIQKGKKVEKMLDFPGFG
jgi:hypothetical protein